jgi:hypothetical protein
MVALFESLDCCATVRDELVPSLGNDRRAIDPAGRGQAGRCGAVVEEMTDFEQVGVLTVLRAALQTGSRLGQGGIVAPYCVVKSERLPDVSHR